MYDILISSKYFQDHINILHSVFDKISHASMTLKFKKFNFLQSKIKFLDHFVSASSITIDSTKFQAIKEIPEPRSKKDLQSFIGFCNSTKNFPNIYLHYFLPYIILF